MAEICVTMIDCDWTATVAACDQERFVFICVVSGYTRAVRGWLQVKAFLLNCHRLMSG